MLTTLHRLSAAFFYLLGASFFIAYVLMRNSLWADPATIWMQVADLPLAASAMIYGGTSVYLSLRGDLDHPSKALPWVIAIPLVLIFTVMVVMNFWPR